MAYKFTTEDRQAIVETATRLGIDPASLTMVMSYESRGMNPSIVGGKGNRYQGLIQFGPSQRAQYGYKPGMTIADQVRGPVYRYLADPKRGLKPGMGLAEIYSVINAGSLTKDGKPRWNANDGNGTIRQHVQRITQQYMGKGSAPPMNVGETAQGRQMPLGMGRNRIHSGPEVAQLQQQLTDLGFNVGKRGADGIFGRDTAAAVRAFEAQTGLMVDRGVAGPQVQGMLQDAFANIGRTSDIMSAHALAPVGPGYPGPDPGSVVMGGLANVRAPWEVAGGGQLSGSPNFSIANPNPAGQRLQAGAGVVTIPTGTGGGVATPYTGERGNPRGSRFAFGVPQQLSFTPSGVPTNVARGAPMPAPPVIAALPQGRLTPFGDTQQNVTEDYIRPNRTEDYGPGRPPFSTGMPVDDTTSVTGVPGVLGAPAGRLPANAVRPQDGLLDLSNVMGFGTRFADNVKPTFAGRAAGPTTGSGQAAAAKAASLPYPSMVAGRPDVPAIPQPDNGPGGIGSINSIMSNPWGLGDIFGWGSGGDKPVSAKPPAVPAGGFGDRYGPGAGLSAPAYPMASQMLGYSGIDAMRGMMGGDTLARSVPPAGGESKLSKSAFTPNFGGLPEAPPPRTKNGAGYAILPNNWASQRVPFGYLPPPPVETGATADPIQQVATLGRITSTGINGGPLLGMAPQRYGAASPASGGGGYRYSSNAVYTFPSNAVIGGGRGAITGSDRTAWTPSGYTPQSHTPYHNNIGQTVDQNGNKVTVGAYVGSNGQVHTYTY